MPTCSARKYRFHSAAVASKYNIFINSNNFLMNQSRVGRGPAGDINVAGCMLEADIFSSLCPWERCLTLIFHYYCQAVYTRCGAQIRTKYLHTEPQRACAGLVDIRMMPGSYKATKQE